MLLLCLPLAAQDAPKSPTPEEQIEYLKAVIATKDAQIETLQALMQYFETKANAPAVTPLQKLTESLSKKYGCEIGPEGLCKAR